MRDAQSVPEGVAGDWIEGILHVVGQLLQVGLLLSQLLLELHELLLLALPNREVLAGTLAPLEGVAVEGENLC